MTWRYFDDGYYKHRVDNKEYEARKHFPGNYVQSHHTTPDGERFTAYVPVESLGKEYKP